MKVKLDVDTREFNRALREYAATVRKDGDLIVNTAAKHLALRYVAETRHADVGKIRALKTIKSIEIARLTKRGKLQTLKSFSRLSKAQQERRTTYEATTLALMYYISELRKRGKSPRTFSNRQALMDGALRMVNARSASVHYLRSGWLAAANKFKDIIAGTGGLRGENLGRKKQGIGGATISTGSRATAEIWNGSLYGKWSRTASSDLIRYANEGLQKAMAISRSKLEQITRERLERAAKKFNHS